MSNPERPALYAIALDFPEAMYKHLAATLCSTVLYLIQCSAGVPAGDAHLECLLCAGHGYHDLCGPSLAWRVLGHELVSNPMKGWTDAQGSAVRTARDCRWPWTFGSLLPATLTELRRH